MSIKIPVSAEFDSNTAEAQVRDFEKKLNQLGREIAKINKTQFTPVSKTSLQDMQAMVKQFDALLKVSNELNRRVKVTGQQGVGFVDLDWNKMFPNQSSRSKQMSRAFQYVTGADFASAGGGAGGGSSWKQTGASIAQAGLRATGGVTGGLGGVAANALGTGMSAGFGAGMAGLVGGAVALGVGKLVGAVADRVKVAEDNAVAYDKLKRTLGDVNVSFAALKTAIGGNLSGGGLAGTGLPIGEAIAQSTRFAKLGNLSGGNAMGLVGEVGAGVGLARAYGLDPSQGVGVLGQLRGVGVTKSEQDTRRFAVLIGETIGKSGAFAKADEVMEAIGEYATNQTRASLGVANSSGYAGMFAGLVGSGIPGLDPSGAGALLSRVNASLAAGGAKGEASQFFTQRLGAARGLDVFDTQIWQEGGAFSTLDNAFNGAPGKESAIYKYYRDNNIPIPKGSETLLNATLGQMKRDYADPRMRLMATANHTGLSMSQSAALYDVQSQNMGDLLGALERSGVSLKDVNMAGIQSLSKVVSGNPDDRMGVATELWGRTGKDKLSDKERRALDDVMRNGSEQQQKDMLTSLVAVRDQEESQGKDVRDSKVALENIKSLMAEQLIPITQSMRDGLLYFQSGGKSPEAAAREVSSAATNERYDKEAEAVKKNSIGFLGQTPEGKAALADIERRRQEELSGIANGGSSVVSQGSAPKGWRAPTGELQEKMRSAEKAYGLPAGTLGSIMKQEIGNDTSYLSDPAKYHYKLDASGRRIAPHTGKISTAFGPFGILESTAADPGYGVAPLKDKGIDEQIRFAAEYAAARAKAAGSLKGGLAGYGEGDAYSKSVMSRIGTQMPSDAAAAKRAADQQQIALRGSFEDLNVTVNMPNGEKSQHSLSPRFTRPNPAGDLGIPPPFATPY